MRYSQFMKTVSALTAFFLASAIIVSVSVLSARAFSARSASVGADIKKETVIIIDAGHGGRDGGASSEDGTEEKELNLLVAQKLCALLSAQGLNTVMTRTEDVMLASEGSSHKKLDDLKSRVGIAEKYGKDAVFISIHMNKYPVEKYSGLQVYYTKNTEDSSALADSVQDTVRLYLQKNNTRETKSAGSGIYVLDNAPCTSVLIECGFLSNREECALLCTDEYRTKLSMCVYMATLDFLEEFRK